MAPLCVLVINFYDCIGAGSLPVPGGGGGDLGEASQAQPTRFLSALLVYDFVAAQM